MHTETLFATPILICSPDIDVEAEWRKMIQRNQIVQEFDIHLAAGTLTPGFLEELGDMFAEHGINPWDWIAAVADNLDYVYTHNIPLETEDGI